MTSGHGRACPCHPDQVSTAGALAIEMRGISPRMTSFLIVIQRDRNMLWWRYFAEVK
jgi:hypothetical protein